MQAKRSNRAQPKPQCDPGRLLGCATHPQPSISRRSQRSANVRISAGTLLRTQPIKFNMGKVGRPPTCPPVGRLVPYEYKVGRRPNCACRRGPWGSMVLCTSLVVVSRQGPLIQHQVALRYDGSGYKMTEFYSQSMAGKARKSTKRFVDFDRIYNL